MSEEQFAALLAAIADLQASIDNIDVRTQRMAEVLELEDRPVEPPEWVNSRGPREAGR